MDERSPTVSAQPPAPLGLWNRLVRKVRIARHRWRRDGERGATMLEWVLLVAAIALPSYGIIVLGLRSLFAHYQLVTTLNGLPFP